LRIHAEEDIPVDITFEDGDAGSDAAATPPPPAVAEMITAVESFFDGREIDAGLTESLLGRIDATEFEASVLREVAGIPRGETASYGEIAERAGYPRAARAVGNVMRSNPFPIIIPCHRVIKEDGSLGGYGGKEDLKSRLLAFESSGSELA
jgi:methylated-DNA-[protein]-cysteine S-methyltransferase